ncbi:MAG: dihydroorotate dehydrogenase [Actinomycetota bacterium]
MSDASYPRLEVKLGDIELKNPVIACSGTFGSGIEYSDFYNTALLGAVTTKSFSLHKRQGNPPPRIFETACGMLNSVGLQNGGIDDFLHNHLPAIRKLNIKPILSIFGENIEEFEKISLAVADITAELLAIELNLSCPNVEKGGMAFCSLPQEVEAVTSKVKQTVKIPVIVKLSPNTGQMEPAAAAARDGGASALSVINTLVGTAFDIHTFKPRLGNIMGGLSGPAIKPVALARVYELCSKKILPVIGMGGIFSWEDAVEFLIAGAEAVGIGTANFVDYHAAEKIIEGIAGYLRQKNIDDVNKIIGKALN